MVPFAPLLEIPVTIWVLAGPYATTQQTAFTSGRPRRSIFTGERLGRAHDVARGRRRHGESERRRVDGVHVRRPATRTSRRCRARSASAPGRINVYLVGLVDGSTSRGNVCIVGGGFAAIAAGAGRGTARARARPRSRARARRRPGRRFRSDQRDAFGQQRAAVPHRGPDVPRAPAHELRAQRRLRPAVRPAGARLRSRYADTRLPGDPQARLGRWCVRSESEMGAPMPSHASLLVAVAARRRDGLRAAALRARTGRVRDLRALADDHVRRRRGAGAARSAAAPSRRAGARLSPGARRRAAGGQIAQVRAAADRALRRGSAVPAARTIASKASRRKTSRGSHARRASVTWTTRCSATQPATARTRSPASASSAAPRIARSSRASRAERTPWLPRRPPALGAMPPPR